MSAFDPSASDALCRELAAHGVAADAAFEVAERAAIIQEGAGKTRWKAGVEAQQLHLGRIIIKGNT